MIIKFANSGLFAASLLVLSPLSIAAFAAESGSTTAQTMTYVKDSVITAKIKAQLADQKIKSLLNISVDTDANGVVVLGGTAANRADKDKAAAIAGATEGVVSVTNEIVIKPAY